jgi:hypothetical protein
MKALGWVIISIILAVIVFILYMSLVMASKYDDISEEYWNEYWGKEDEHRQVPNGNLENQCKDTEQEV